MLTGTDGLKTGLLNYFNSNFPLLTSWLHKHISAKNVIKLPNYLKSSWFVEIFFFLSSQQGIPLELVGFFKLVEL